MVEDPKFAAATAVENNDDLTSFFFRTYVRTWQSQSHDKFLRARMAHSIVYINNCVPEWLTIYRMARYIECILISVCQNGSL